MYFYGPDGLNVEIVEEKPTRGGLWD